MIAIPLVLIFLSALWSRGRLEAWIAEDRAKPKEARMIRGIGFLIASAVAAFSGVLAVMMIGNDGRGLTATGLFLASLGGVAFVVLQARGSAALLAQAIESKRSPERPE